MQPCPTSQHPMPSRRPPSPARSCAPSKTSSRAPPLPSPPTHSSARPYLSHNRTRYEVITKCGIPEVTLLGTEADWADLHARFIVLADTWMHRTPETCGWVKAVDKFLKQFIAARSGEIASCRFCGANVQSKRVVVAAVPSPARSFVASHCRSCRSSRC